MGCGGESIPADLAVEQTHHAFDDRDVGGIRRLRAVQQQWRHQILSAEVGIEVASRPTGRQRVVARVDIVRAHLEARNLQARRPKCPHQPGCHGGLAMVGEALHAENFVESHLYAKRRR